jgi:hypothetical protein
MKIKALPEKGLKKLHPAAGNTVRGTASSENGLGQALSCTDWEESRAVRSETRAERKIRRPELGPAAKCNQDLDQHNTAARGMHKSKSDSLLTVQEQQRNQRTRQKDNFAAPQTHRHRTTEKSLSDRRERSDLLDEIKTRDPRTQMGNTSSTYRERKQIFHLISTRFQL